jgi:hypothetical protein
VCEVGRCPYLMKIGTFFNRISLVIYFSDLVADIIVQDKAVDAEVTV